MYLCNVPAGGRGAVDDLCDRSTDHLRWLRPGTSPSRVSTFRREDWADHLVADVYGSTSVACGQCGAGHLE